MSMTPEQEKEWVTTRFAMPSKQRKELARKEGESQGAQVGLPTEGWDSEMDLFTSPGQNGWIIGWHQNILNQLRIKVMCKPPYGGLLSIEREC